jgi:hypothetical protein
VTELRRLFDAQPDEFAIELLRSADSDAPSAPSLADAAAVLGVGALFVGAGAATGTAAAAAGAAKAAALSAPAAGLSLSPLAAAGLAATPAAATSTAVTVTFAVLAKSATLGMVAGLAVMGGFYSTIGAEHAAPAVASRDQGAESSANTAPSRRVPARSNASSRDGEAAVAAAPAAAAFELATPSIAEPGAAGRATPRSASPGLRSTAGKTRSGAVAVPAQAAAAQPAPAQAASEPAAAPKKASLSLEVELLDRARSALRAGDALGALSVLDDYASAKQSGVLAPEAQVLRIQVLERLGRVGAASTLARDFVTRHPGSRHAAALRQLAERADDAP